MKPGAAFFLQVVVVLIGSGTLALLLGEPHLEGRNAHATTFEVYFHDPFLAYAYVGSIPFFMALYRAFGLFGQARRKGAFSWSTVVALRAIKRCAIVVVGFVAVGVVFILALCDRDDRPAGVFMSGLVTLALGFLIAAAAKFERILQKTLRRSEAIGP